MDGFFVFDLSNDLVFKYANEPMKARLLSIACKMGVMDPEADELTSDSLIHIFNPLLANLRFMLIQFDNSFNYVKCQYGFNMVFDEYFGFMFITISDEKSIEFMQRAQGVSISFLRHLFGPAIFQLKTDNKKSEMLINLISGWKKLYVEKQDVCLEVIEHLTVSIDMKKNIVSSLEVVLEKLKQDPQLQRNHAVVFVGNKFLTMFSMRTSQQLVPSDILFLNIFCQTIPTSTKIDTYLLFLRGSTNSCIPHKVHRITISPHITLLLLSEIGNAIISSNLYEAFVQLNKIKILQSQADMDALVIETEKLDKAVKSVIDVQKKLKNSSTELDESAKNFQQKYDSLKKKYVEMLKIMDKNQLVKVESYFPYFFEATKDLYRVSFMNDTDKKMASEQEKMLFNISALFSDKMSKYFDILETRTNDNSTISSYLEEFAGLVHFIFIDRQRGTCFAPNIDVTAKETSSLIKKKVWAMIESSRSYLQNGQTTVIWKDFGFSYSYSLWFEDSNGQVLKPKDQVSSATSKSSPIPGMLAYDYYHNLIEGFFPKMVNGVNKIKCFELLTVHLGLVTPHLQLEHSRRLVATIYDMNEMVSNNLFDLL